MPHDLMLRCAQRREYLVNGKHEWRWKEVAVADAVDAGGEHIRCMHCHGSVRTHRQKVAHGPQDHVEHRSRQDSVGCRGGIYFDGSHRLSATPVV
jgi:hypothetical protein